MAGGCGRAYGPVSRDPVAAEEAVRGRALLGAVVQPRMKARGSKRGTSRLFSV